MSDRVGVIVPVLNRPHRVKPLLESLASSSGFVTCEAIFVVSKGDDAELAAVVESGARYFVVPWKPGHGDWARKINEAFRRYHDDYTFFLFGADDLRFHDGWIEHALAQYKRTGFCVIGTNDGGNRRVMAGVHSTHPLVHRDYLECGTVDEEGKVLHEGYTHNFTDDEFVQTAAARGTYIHASDSFVEHMHPDWGKGEMDDTYVLGKKNMNADMILFNERRKLWGR